MEIISTVLGIITLFCVLSFLFIQPLSAIIRLLVAKRKNSKYAIGIKRYLGAFLLFYVYLFILANIQSKPYSFQLVIHFAYIFIILLGYWRHIIKWHFKHKRIKAYDRMKLLKSVQGVEKLEERMLHKPNYILYTKLG